jgi:hypothetical protein
VVWGYNSRTELSRAGADEFPKTLIRASVMLTNVLTILSEAGLHIPNEALYQRKQN